VYGNYAFLSPYGNGPTLDIVDISDLKSPQLTGTHTSLSNIYGVAVSGATAIVQIDWNGMESLNVSAPSSPSILQSPFIESYSPTNSTNDGQTIVQGRDIKIQGSYAYVANYSGSLSIYDISNPQKITHVGNLSLPGYPTNIQINGGYAYVSDYYQGLSIVNISNPTNPSLTSQINLNTTVTFYSAASGGYLYVPTNQGINIYNVTNPSSPTLAGSIAGEGGPISISGDTLYAVNTQNGNLDALSISNPMTPSVIATVPISGGSISSLQATTNGVFVGVGNNLYIYSN